VSPARRASGVRMRSSRAVPLKPRSAA
jgi:hypothetical protein